MTERMCERMEGDGFRWRCSECGMLNYWDAVTCCDADTDRIRVVPSRFCAFCGARVVATDTIEALRADMCHAWNGAECDGLDECPDDGCEVIDWLARAEKLFGGGAE